MHWSSWCTLKFTSATVNTDLPEGFESENADVSDASKTANLLKV